MRYTLHITGSGGQGVMSAGASLATSAAAFGYATFLPWYGAAQRGGVAKCTVVLSDKPIVSPLPGKCMGMIAMNDAACAGSLAELAEGGLLIRNASRCKDKIRSGKLTLLDVPADDIAKECGSERMANMVLIGALLGCSKMLPPTVIEQGIQAKLGGKSEAVLQANIAALRAGMAYGADPSHIKVIDNAAAANCRYGIDKTTVGEILDTPELRAIVEQLFPQVLNHPLLEAGRTFKFIDAVPYMKDMLKEDDLDKFQDALEALG